MSEPDENERKLMVNRFYDVHEEGLIRVGLNDYFDWQDKLAEKKPNYARRNTKLYNDQLEFQSRFIKGEVSFDQYADAVQDWFIHTIELYEQWPN